MHRQETEVRLPVLVTVFMIVLIIFLIFMTTIFGLQNIRHKETIEIYEEYYVLDKEMDIMYRQWVQAYQHYGEVEYYLKFYPEPYLRYLELKKIIGEIKE